MTTVVLQPDETSGKDAVISTLDPDFNSATGAIKWGREAGGYEYISLIQFDLSSIPVGSIISSAILDIYVDYSYNISVEKAINVKRITSSWNESTVTYNGRPSHDVSSRGSSASFTDLIGHKTIDITSLVQEWINEVYPNYGVRLHNVDESLFASYVTGYSSGHGTPSERPSLTIDYVAEINPNTPTGLIKTGVSTDTTPNFSVDISDPNTSQQIKARFEIYQDDGVTLVGITESAWRTGAGNVTGEYASSLAVGKYKVRAKTIDDTARESSYTGFVSFNVANTIIKDLAMSWDINSNANKDLPMSWEVLMSNIKDLPVSWNVYNSVEIDIPVLWEIATTWRPIIEPDQVWIEVLS